VTLDILSLCLSRDLSLQNFKCYKAIDKWKAILLDYDLSSILKDGQRECGATSKHRTGTTPFMARELLDSPPEGVTVEHVYAHELESWLYILLHVQLGYTNRAPKGNPLKGWWVLDWHRVFEKKELFFTTKRIGYKQYLTMASVFAR
jgi:hypothetical protein